MISSFPTVVGPISCPAEFLWSFRSPPREKTKKRPPETGRSQKTRTRTKKTKGNNKQTKPSFVCLQSGSSLGPRNRFVRSANFCRWTLHSTPVGFVRLVNWVLSLPVSPYQCSPCELSTIYYSFFLSLHLPLWFVRLHNKGSSFFII